MPNVSAIFGPALGEHPLLLAFVFLLFFGFTFPIPEEAALILVGLALRGAGPSYLEALAAALLALVLADLLYYSVARFMGPRLIRIRLLRRVLKPERIDEAELYFLRRGAGIVFACRFVIGLRTAAILSAGLLRLTLKRFLAYDAAALSLGAAAWLAVGYLLGSRLGDGLGGLERILSIVGPLAIVAAAFLLYRGVMADRAKVLADRREEGTAAGMGSSRC